MKFTFPSILKKLNGKKSALITLLFIISLMGCSEKVEIDFNKKIKLNELVWEVPQNWTATPTGQDLVPWFINGPEDLKFSVFLYRNKSEVDIWPITKLWRTSLKLPILSQDELQKSLTWQDNNSILYNAKNKEKGILGCFLVLHGNLWVVRLEAPLETLDKYEKVYQQFCASIEENPALTQRIKALEAVEDERAYMELASYYSKGEGVKINLPLMKGYLEKARKAGSQDATYRLALFAIKNKNLGKAIELLNEGVENKHIDSIKKLAGLVLDKNKDYEFARNLLAIAAEMGDTNSMYFLGTIYYGKNPISSEAKAAKWITMAADKEHIGALRTLGLFYKRGYGVKKDNDKALEYLIKAAQNKDMLALEALAEIYQKGKIVKKDSVEVIKYLLKATAVGSSKSLLMLSNLYFNGDGIEKDSDKGFEILEKAIRKGNVAAMLKMAEIFSDGKIVPKNLKVAYNFYNMAAAKGDANGMFHLSLALFLGKGCAKNEDSAVKWLKRSALKGHEPAQEMIKKQNLK
jgi:TPR repeat protein